MNLCQIYKLEILKFMLKNKNKTLPNCFKNYFITPSETHNYPTRADMTERVSELVKANLAC